jgi:hypothetical protein
MEAANRSEPTISRAGSTARNRFILSGGPRGFVRRIDEVNFEIPRVHSGFGDRNNSHLTVKIYMKAFKKELAPLKQSAG